jgi:hypothetical protein
LCRFGGFFPVEVEGPDPDIAEAHGVAVVLEFDRAGGFVGGVSGDGPVLGGSDEGAVILDEDAVVEDGDICGAFEVAVVVEVWGLEDYIVGLPLPRLALTRGGYWP